MDKVVSTLLGSPSLKELPASEIRHLTLQYPYASFLHLLRSRKLKDINDPEYPASVAMTALYFSNPHWLHHQLQTTTAGSRVREWEKAMQPREEEKTDPVAPPETEDPIEPVGEAGAQPENASVEAGPEDAMGHDTVIREEPAEQTDDHPPTGKLADILNAPVDPSATLEVPIEPLYTVDYFASLGIRAPTEPGTGDALGYKLKSFTEWLKAMRKINPEKMDVQMDASSESRIRKEADLSNSHSGVVTETMAEVLQRQGLRDQAIQLYQKLSLLEPAKSAYFAARIAELKDQRQ